jgi:NitT/TauT family transport system substrate-binding protein
MVLRPPWRPLAATALATVTGLAVGHPAPVNRRDEQSVGNLGRLLSRSRKSRYALPEQAVLNCQNLLSGARGAMKMVSARRWPARPWSSGRAWIAAGCAAASAALLAGCQLPGSGSSGALEQAPAGSSITVASVPGVGDAPLYVAQQEGLFRQAGLTVHIRSYPTAAAEVAALHSGAANVAAGDYASFFYAQEQATAPASATSKKPADAAVPMVVLADGYDAAPDIVDVLVRPDSRITTPQNLQGKTIGTAEPQLMPYKGASPPYSLETVAASSVLENDGVRLATVRFQPMPEAQLIGALKSGAVDAILVTEPQIYQAESQIGARAVLDAGSGETVNLPLDGYFASAAYAKQHRDVLAAFHAALMRAQASANQPAPLNNALTHYAGMSRETASLITVGAYPTSLRVSSLQRVADLMSFYGALARPLDVSSMVFR